MAFVNAILVILAVVLAYLGYFRRAVSEAEWVIVNPQAAYPEGPVWIKNQLFYVEYSTHSISGWNGTHNARIGVMDGCGPSGLTFIGDDQICVTCYDRNSLLFVTLDGRVVNEMKTDLEGKMFIGPNDLTVDGFGDIYFTSSGQFDRKAPSEGALYYVAKHDVQHSSAFRFDAPRRLTHSPIHYSNGIGLNANETILFVSEMLENRILQFHIESPGHLTELQHPTVFADLSNLAPFSFPSLPDGSLSLFGPDGLKVVSLHGRDYVFVAQFGAGRILQLNEQGSLVSIISLPSHLQCMYTTNVFVRTLDDENVQLFVTAVSDHEHVPYPGMIVHVSTNVHVSA